MVLRRLEPEDVAPEVEGGDLPAPVVEDPVGANRTAENLVDVVRRFAFAEDLRIAIEGHGHAGKFNRIEQGSDAWNRTCSALRAVSGGDLISGMSEHGLGPPTDVSAGKSTFLAGKKIQINTLRGVP